MFLVFIFIALIGPLVHLLVSRKPKTAHRILELYLQYMLFALVGLSGIYGFMGHAFVPDKIAQYIGWPAGSPFQFEVACANLALGVLGILCLWIRGNFWTATIIADAVFLWGAAYGHIKDIIDHQNYAPGNAGLVLYLDILVPLILIILLIAYRASGRKKA